MQMKRAISTALFMCFLTSGNIVFAESVQGRIVSVDPQNNQIVLAPMQGTNQPYAVPDMLIEVPREITLQGFQSLSDLSIGDEISIQGYSPDSETEFQVQEISLRHAQSSILPYHLEEDMYDVDYQATQQSSPLSPPTED